MQAGRAVTQTIILAAGNGSRLEGASAGVPKPLTTVGGLPLIAHAIMHAQAAGCSEAIVVVGHEGDRVRTAATAIVARMPAFTVRFVENRDPAAPNGVSLLAAESVAAPRFFLQMVDHLFAEPALPRLSARALAAGETGRVLVDRAPHGLDLSDATKVQLSGTRVTAIGKGLESWDAIDAGCFVLTRAVFEALRSVSALEPLTVSSGMRQLAAGGALGFAELTGVSWVDVDTPADRQSAETLLMPAAASRLV